MRFVTICLGLSLLLNFDATVLFSQDPDFQSPLDIPLLLSGNFGELRSTHFHAGIDLKTLGKIGQPVRALESGYVSRVKVQAGGYGHAIYIKHIDGNTSVYGHLDSFYPEVAAFIKSEQYRRKSFEVDIYVEANKYIVTKGMQIGVSGNTGRSGGPHLHLELRDDKQVPMNLLLHNLPVEDTIPPKIRRLFLYDNMDAETFQWQNKMSIPVLGVNGEYTISNTIEGSVNVAFGVEVYDYLNGSANRCGVYTLDLFVDSVLIFSSKIDKVSFGEARYIRTYGDYAEKKLNNRSVHRLFVEPNNKLSVYNTFKNRGIIHNGDDGDHEGLIVAADAHGNISQLSFRFTLGLNKDKNFTDTGNVKFYFDRDNVYEDDFVSFSVQKNALYANKWFNYSNALTEEHEIANIYTLGDELIPMHKNPELKIKPKGGIHGISPEKLIIAKIDNKGNYSTEGGRWSDGAVKAKVSGFGRYTIIADTTNPTIQPVSFREGWYAAGDVLSFKIEDDLSGIKTYNGYINDKWVLFKFDAKSGALSYEIDPEKLSRSKQAHTLKIYVMDERNNIESFTGEFYY